jgi:hypothetical protein
MPGLSVEFVRRSTARRASTIDQHVNLTMKPLSLFKCRTGLLRHLKVGSKYSDSRVDTRKLLYQLLQCTLQRDRASRDKADSRALSQKAFGAGQTDAFASSSDKYMLLS